MAWFHSDCEGHDGWLVGLVDTGRHLDGRGRGAWRELGPDDPKGNRVDAVQVVCSCGWRSPRLVAPFWATWTGTHVQIDDNEDFEDTVGAPLWLAHGRWLAAEGFDAPRGDRLWVPETWRAKQRRTWPERNVYTPTARAPRRKDD